MPSYYDENQGFFTREPSWHRLEDKVLAEWPGTWSLARVEAGLLWEPKTEPVYAKNMTDGGPGEWNTEQRFVEIPGFQAIRRSDNLEVLAIQSAAYRVISNTDFGDVIETVLGGEWGQQRLYEGVFTLFGGRMVIAVIRDQSEEQISRDPSKTLTYTVFCSRHDGQGGLRVIRTKIRVVCWNTWSAAEHAGVENKTAFTVRHTANWNEKVAEVRDKLALTAEDDAWYAEVMEQLAAKVVTSATRDKFLQRLLPVGDDMTPRMRDNRLAEREQIRTILAGPTCEGIDKTAYGLLQAAGEWADHYRRFKSEQTYVNRTLFTKEPLKIRAFKVAKDLAGVK